MLSSLSASPKSGFASCHSPPVLPRGLWDEEHCLGTAGFPFQTMPAGRKPGKTPCESDLSPGSTLPALSQTLHVPLRNKN